MNYNNPELKILNLTHSDLDGVSSNIVLRNFYKDIETEYITYQSEERVITNMIAKYKDKVDLVIITDFYPSLTMSQIREAFPNILVLDHHETAQKYHDNKTVIINTSACGAMLTYRFVKTFKDISYLDDLINITNDWDMFILSDKRSRFFNNIYWEMGPKWFTRRFLNGNTKLYPEEQKYLIDAQAEFKKLYANLEISDLSNNGVFFETDRFMNECVEELKKEGYKWFAIKNKNALSIRCDEIDLTKVFKIMNVGGGHAHAGGIPLKYNDDIMIVLNRLQLAVDAVYSND